MCGVDALVRRYRKRLRDSACNPMMRKLLVIAWGCILDRLNLADLGHI